MCQGRAEGGRGDPSALTGPALSESAGETPPPALALPALALYNKLLRDFSSFPSYCLFSFLLTLSPVSSSSCFFF